MTGSKTLFSRRRMLTVSASACMLPACETLDPAVLEGILAGSSGLLSEADAAAGIRAALDNGISHAVGIVGKTNGFWNDDLIRIPLPSKLAQVQSTLRSFGASGLLDDLALQLNRGAEKAAPVAKDIFVDAVSSLSIQDAIGIVRGADTAATEYLQGKTSTRLAQAFSPIMETALSQTGALQILNQADRQLSSVGVGGLGASASRELITHGVDYGLSGVFHYIAQEEKLIRANPAKRTSEILRRVFGATV